MIEVRDVVKSFDGRPVLRGVSAVFRPGRITALVGSNGSGKTTLIRILMGLVRPDAGTIEIDGRTLDGDAAYRADVGYMSQGARLPEHLTGRRIMAMLSDLRGAASIMDCELEAKFGLAAELDRPVRVLSGGNRQKVSAVIAFLFRPSIIILDEPTAGLDPISSGVLRDKLRRERARGRTVILTSHVMSEVELIADDMVVLADGVVLRADPVRGQAHA